MKLSSSSTPPSALGQSISGARPRDASGSTRPPTLQRLGA